jgi:hypothetical protein
MKRVLASGMLFLLAAAVGLQGRLTTTMATAAATGTTGVGDKASDNDGVLDLYFTGSRRSQIEPCGCQTKQRGGMQYEASLYDQHPGRPTVRVDVGEWTRPNATRAPVEALKTHYLLRAMKEIGLDAINVGLNDIQFDKAFYDHFLEEHPDLSERMISANVFISSNTREHAFAPNRIIQRTLADGKTVRIGITGVTSLDRTRRRATEADEITHGDYLVKEPQVELVKQVEALRPRVDLLIVLFSTLNREEIDKVASQVSGIDFLATSAYLVDRNALLVFDSGMHLLHTPNALGKELGIVSLKPGEGAKWTTAGDAESIYVSLDRPIDQGVLALINEFKEQTQRLDIDIPKYSEMEEIYAGAAQCASCHRAIYESWEKTGHSHAITTLVNVAQQFNPECVQCHVTGFREGNGFYSVSHMPSMRMANVQCEVCHGPSREHLVVQQQILAGVSRWKTPAEYEMLLEKAKRVLPPKAVAAETCVRCHQGENDPHFDYESTIHHVDHSDVPPEDRRTPKPAAAPEPTAVTDPPVR